ncbi:MAG: lysophospholipid acyltransferase family protein [Thermodesulfobacteriota bacterium]|nr:lysophospholipid acyltransferase family protein [Thermodesulfobacteriota bacterium]
MHKLSHLASSFTRQLRCAFRCIALAMQRKSRLVDTQNPSASLQHSTPDRTLGDQLLLLVVPFIASRVMRLLNLTLKNETLGEDHLRNVWGRGEQAIISFWHDQLFLLVFGYPGQHAKLLISASKDGELLARTMKYFDQDTVRGSSSRGGRAAFKKMLDLCKEDVDIVLTPDGPKGPRRELKDGVIQLARMSGRPVIPMAFVCSRGHRFKSWDRFLFPYPFGRGIYAYGEPLYFDKQEGVDRFRERLIKAMQDNQQQAEARLESYGVSAI